MLMGPLMVQGIQPGPAIMTEHADLFWGPIASMWLGNLMLLVLNLPLIGVWIKLLETPYRFIYPTILLLSCIGCYAVSNQTLDIRIAAFATLAGYVLKRLDCSPGPLIIAMILGPILEENMRRSMLISRGDTTMASAIFGSEIATRSISRSNCSSSPRPVMMEISRGLCAIAGATRSAATPRRTWGSQSWLQPPFRRLLCL